MRKQLIASVVSLSLVTSSVLVSPVAHASGAVAGATEITQLLNNAELVTQVAQQAQQLATQLQQYQTMLTNLQNIPNQIWGPIQQDLMALQQVAAQGQALSFAASNVVQQFENTYTGFKKAGDFVTQYKDWSKRSMDSIKGSLAAANKQFNQFATEEGTLAQLRSMSQSSVGQLQALQVGSQIAVEQAAQLQKLRGLIMAQMQAQNAFLATQQQQKDTTTAQVEAVTKYVNPRGTFPGLKGGSK